MDIKKETMELKEELDRVVKDAQKVIKDAQSKKTELEGAIKSSPWKWVGYIAVGAIILTVILIGMCSKTGTVL